MIFFVVYHILEENARVFSAFCKKQKKAARTCKKLPVASFCASETAERIPLGAAEGFNWIA
jgi:hypothetical protein